MVSKGKSGKRGQGKRKKGLKKGIPAGCAALLELDAKDYREILAKCLKFILPQKYWDYDGPTYYRWPISHGNLQEMEQAFRGLRSAKMQNTNDMEIFCLRWLVKFDIGLWRRGFKLRDRKARATGLRKWVQQQIRRIAPRQREALQGTNTFCGAVRKQFLTSRR